MRRPAVEEAKARFTNGWRKWLAWFFRHGHIQLRSAADALKQCRDEHARRGGGVRAVIPWRATAAVQRSVLDDLRMHSRAHVAETWRRPPTRRSRYLLMPLIPCLESALLWARLQMLMPSQTITPVIAVI